MKEKEVRDFILNYLKEKLDLLGLHEREMKGDFNFVQSGLLDSMAFVDMVTSMENAFGLEIDFENEVDDDSLTTMNGLIKLFT